MGDTLTEGQKLEKGGSLTSNNGAYTLTLQDDANLVLAARGEAVWSTGTNRQDVQRAEVQSDGNFVLYTADKLLWHTGTQGKKEVKLVLQDDRNVVLYAATGPAWSTKTETDTAPSPAPDAAPEPVSEVAPAAVEEPVPPPAPEAEAPAPPLPPAATRSPHLHGGVGGHALGDLRAVLRRRQQIYQRIADASGVSNPDLIHPGQVVTIP